MQFDCITKDVKYPTNNVVFPEPVPARGIAYKKLVLREEFNENKIVD